MSISRLGASCVINQNNILNFSINSSKPTWPIEINAILEFLEQFASIHFDLFPKKVLTISR